MARAFDITSATDTVKLDASGRGEVSFTVTNGLRRPVRAKASVQPEGEARLEWMSLAEEAERELPMDGTVLYTVRFSVPAGAKPGRYTFSLWVASVANPDEEYSRGPTVAFEVQVAPPPPKKKPFPWAWVALAGGVVVLIAVVAAVLVMRGPQELGDKCTAEKGCAELLVCTTEGRCVGAEGFKGCEKPEDCITQRCVEGLCQPGVAPGEACSADVDCRAPGLCHEGKCLLPDGAVCELAATCSSGRCLQGMCQPPVSLGETCENNTDCRAPTVCFERICLMPNGQACAHEAQCASGNCQQGNCQRSTICRTPCPLGSICVNGTCIIRPVVRLCSPPCTLGFVCIDGRCQRSFNVPIRLPLQQFQVP